MYRRKYKQFQIVVKYAVRCYCDSRTSKHSWSPKKYLDAKKTVFSRISREVHPSLLCTFSNSFCSCTSNLHQYFQCGTSIRKIHSNTGFSSLPLRFFKTKSLFAGLTGVANSLSSSPDSCLFHLTLLFRWAAGELHFLPGLEWKV